MARKTSDDYLTEIGEYLEAADEASAEAAAKRWIDRYARIEIQVARNESDPWTETELVAAANNAGETLTPLPITTIPMKLKKDCGFRQVGDYVAEIITPVSHVYCSTLIERKTKLDLYGSIINSKRRTRLYNEAGRCRIDPRFTDMRIIAECPYDDFLKFIPWHGRKQRQQENRWNDYKQKKETIIGTLDAMGAPIIFAGNRKNAIALYYKILRQWSYFNYKSLLGPYLSPQ